MEKILTVNIGLKNNKFNQKTIVEYFQNLYKWQTAYKLEKYTFEVGQWGGQKEITFVGLFSYRFGNASKVLTDFELIASVMDQQCIAIKCQGLHALAYNISTKNKNKVFNNKYFYDIIKEPQKTVNNEKTNKISITTNK
jgi:hypothetical protein